MKKLLLIATAVIAFTGCKEDKKQELAWQSKFDSLNNELKIKNESVVMLQNVTAYLDSIESYKKWLKIEMETGIDEQDLSTRMKNLNQFVKQTDKTIRDLEKTRSGYADMVAKLRKDFDKKSSEIVKLQQQLDSYLEQNNNLIVLVSERDQEIETKNLTLTQKDNEIKAVEMKVEELLKQARNLEAESYYSRGKALELAAQRTKLAPKKKRQTLKDAYALYQQAYDKGYESASQDISRLKDTVE